MVANALGRAIRIDTTGKSVSFTGRGPYFTGSFRLSFAFTVLGTVNNGGTIFRANSTGGTNNNQIDIYTLTGGILRADFYGSTGFPSVATADTASGAIVAGGTYIVTVSYDRATNVSQWFVNGAPSGSASTTVARNGESSTITVGGASAGAAANIDLNFVGVESIYNGVAQDNLWGRFYAPRSIWVPVSAGGGSATNLTVQDATHAHTADSPTLTVTTSTSLTIADATHAHAADNLTLSIVTVTDLAIADATHAHTADNLTLSVSGATDLTIQDATHGHTADAPTLTLGYVDLVIFDALHGHTADNVSLGGLYTDLELILKILSNRQELNAGTGTFTIYDDDSVSVLFTASAWADAAGTTPYSGGTLGRIDALA